jgi:glycosyltransferase involved in cell wall biosynthesis
MDQGSLLSATIIAKNEARNIERCILSLQGIVDEIVVLDSFSTDQTQAICERLGVRFYQEAWRGYAGSKNRVNELASHSWILSIDADEEVSPKLRKAISTEKKNGFEGVYKINRLTNYCGSWIRHSGWYPDAKLRLFRKDQAKWSGEWVHEHLELLVPLSVKPLKGNLLHYSYYSRKEHKAKADHYSKLTARKMSEANRKHFFMQPYLSAIGRFFGMYILKGGWLDGKAGWHIACISAQSNILKYKELKRINLEKRLNIYHETVDKPTR